MEKWKPLNMQVRSWVIGHVLRLEQTSSSAIRAMLRMFNKESKTLGNQSSALPFKSKIDLLLDLEEIDKTEYSHLLKLMEIRNQFAHNPNATSFEQLDNINPDINKYLLKFESKDSNNDGQLEERLKTVFADLFQLTAGKLLSIEIEYTEGMERDMRSYINHKVVENIDSIWKNALNRNKERTEQTATLFFLNNEENAIDEFYSDFKIAMHEFTLEELKNIEGDGIKAIFKRKVI